MVNFGTITKTQARTHFIDFVDLCFKSEQRDVAFLEIITPEQPPLECIRLICLSKCNSTKKVLIHSEFQTTDSSEPAISLRMAGYIIRTIETYRLPVYSSVIYLCPDACRKDPGHKDILWSLRVDILWKFSSYRVSGRCIGDAIFSV